MKGLSFSSKEPWGSRAKEWTAGLQWSMRRAALALGPPGWIAVGLLAVSAWLMMIEIPQLDAEQAKRQADLDRLQQVQAHPVIRAPEPKPLDILRTQLETQDHFTVVVDDLNTFLAAANVTLVEATLGAPTFKDLPGIGRIEMAVTAKGTYPAIKTAIGKLLDQHPGLGLEQLVLEKNEPASATLDAHLHFVYFFKR